MRRAVFTWLVGWVAFSGSTISKAQVPASPPARTSSVKLDLLPLLASGYQVSAEHVWGRAYRQALVVTPQFYRGAVTDLTSELSEGGHDRVRGYGLEVQHRIYLRERITPQAGFYLGYGPHYQHFEVEFQARSWGPELNPNGLTYYEHRLRDQRETIDRYGATAVVGGQFFLPNSPVFFDGYIGMGVRKSSSRATLPGNRYASNRLDYGYEGQFLPVGFRVGVAW